MKSKKWQYFGILLDLVNKINEPMTGRKWTFFLPPLSVGELKDTNGYVDELGELRNRLLYGAYPAVVGDIANAKMILSGLTDESLYKDVLNLGDIIKTDKLKKEEFITRENYLEKLT